MGDDGTIIFKVDDMENYMITETLVKVRKALDEKGYDGINQIVGYIIRYLAYIQYKRCSKIFQNLEKKKLVKAY